jgi:ETC complex I subunit conserved region
MHVRQLPDLPMQLPEDPSEVGILAAQPSDQKARHVIIGQHAKSAHSSFTDHMYVWHLNWQREDESSNPLMGWSQSTDPQYQVDMQFDSPEQAINFCKKVSSSLTLSVDAVATIIYTSALLCALSLCTASASPSAHCHSCASSE